jgi:AcrR family transcriptional regulator
MGRHPAHLAEQRERETRGRILVAAHAIVSEGGYGAASMSAVAEGAQVAVGSLYRRFDSKGELFAEVFRAAAGREQALIEMIVAPDGRPVGARLARAVETFAGRALAAPTLAYALMAEPVDPAVEAARLESKRAYRDVFAALLQEGVDNGELAPLDPEPIASALVGALQEALIGPLASRAGGEALIASLVSFAASAVGVREGNREEIHGHR